MVVSTSKLPTGGLGGRPPAQEWAAELGIPAVGLVTKILRLNMLVSRVLDEVTSQVGIAKADHMVLGVLRWSPGNRSSPTRICEVLGRSTGGMTLTLDRLEAAGWLHSTQDPDDRRRVIITLSAAGLEITTQVNERLHAWEDSLAADAGARAAAERKVDDLLEQFARAAPSSPAPPRRTS